MNQRILNGIQPSGELHIGNYLGSLKNCVELQESGKFDCYFFIADLHSLNEDFEPGEKKHQQILDLMATFLAAGLNPEKSTLFIQSQVPAHTELAWIFNTLVPMAELERMTQYKDKAAHQSSNINVGLFEYPVLQAADILLYKPALIPVGQDQFQHLEFTNTIVRKFNNKFGKTFTEIKPYLKNPIHVMSLAKPERKMSKTEPGSFINMFEGPDEIRKKLAKAVTATDAPEGQMPLGVANLFNLLVYFNAKDIHDRFMKEYKAGSIKYSDLKEAIATVISDYFAPMREKYNELTKDTNKLTRINAEGAKKAAEVAEATLAEVKSKIGLL